MKEGIKVPLILYALACFMPVFKEDYTPGIQALTMGWVGCFGNFPILFSWLANITFFAALVISPEKRMIRLVFSVVTLVFGICFLQVKEILISEGGQTDKVSPGIGFYFWMAAFLYLFFSLIINKKTALV